MRVSIVAGSVPLFQIEWEGWQQSGEPEDLPVNSCNQLPVTRDQKNTDTAS
jgi:hypothetical protein